LNKQVARILPDGRMETKAYDANGLLIKATDFKEQVTGFN
jgi:YD repeat-containing protein